MAAYLFVIFVSLPIHERAQDNALEENVLKVPTYPHPRHNAVLRYHHFAHQPAPRPFNSVLLETIHRIRIAVLFYACGQERLAQFAFPDSVANVPQTSNVEERMCSIFKTEYKNACIVPGAVQVWDTIHPGERLLPADAVQNQHPIFYGQVKRHLDTCPGGDLIAHQSDVGRGICPAAQTVACASILFESIGSYFRNENECVGAAYLWGEYVIEQERFFERQDQLRMNPDIPMLLRYEKEECLGGKTFQVLR